MAVHLLFLHSLLDHCLIYLHPTHLTDFPTSLPQAPANDYSQQGGEKRDPLLVSLIANEPTDIKSF